MLDIREKYAAMTWLQRQQWIEIEEFSIIQQLPALAIIGIAREGES